MRAPNYNGFGVSWGRRLTAAALLETFSLQYELHLHYLQCRCFPFHNVMITWEDTNPCI
jgi:hypothetical protein